MSRSDRCQGADVIMDDEAVFIVLQMLHGIVAAFNANPNPCSHEESTQSHSSAASSELNDVLAKCPRHSGAWIGLTRSGGRQNEGVHARHPPIIESHLSATGGDKTAIRHQSFHLPRKQQSDPKSPIAGQRGSKRGHAGPAIINGRRRRTEDGFLHGTLTQSLCRLRFTTVRGLGPKLE